MDLGTTDRPARPLNALGAMSRSVLISWAVVACCVMPLVKAYGGPLTPVLYWSDFGRQAIMSINPDGTGLQTVISDLYYPRDIVFDERHDHMYWTDPSGINRANGDGTDVERVLSLSGVPRGLDIDPIGGYLYYARSYALERVRLNGTGHEVLFFSDSSYADAVAIDAADDRLYWSDALADAVSRSDLDGLNRETLVYGTYANVVPGLALDLAAGHMYWSETTVHGIMRANLDGSGMTRVVDTLGAPGDLALDLVNGRMYWIEGRLGDNAIRSANLDGTDVHIVFDDLHWNGNKYMGLRLVPEPSTLAIALLGFVLLRRRLRLP